MSWRSALRGVLLMLASASVGAAPDGARLYQAYCAACHGDKGEGGVGVPLALASFLESVDDNFLRMTIRQGRPGRVMPAFRILSDAQLDALVAHVRGFSGKPAPAFPAQPVAGNVEHGGQLFGKHCVQCHGENGEGGKGTGVTFSRRRHLPVIAPALNNPGFQAAASDAMILHTLVQGREGTPMRSFLAEGLEESDLDDIVAFVRTLRPLHVDSVDQPAADAVIRMASPYTLEETVANLEQSIVDQNFTLIRVESMDIGLVPEGEEDPHQVVLHFCNFSFLFEALKTDPRVGMFLPCRITVVEHAGKVEVMTINPLYLSRLFNNDELNEACETMRDLYVELLEDATL